MPRVLRNDIVWADRNPVRGGEQTGLRPVLVLGPDVFNERSGTVSAVALTGQEPRPGFLVPLELSRPEQLLQPIRHAWSPARKTG